MEKILIKIEKNNIIFKKRVKLTSTYKNLLNTNTIVCNTLVFSDEYILKNPKIIKSFIIELCENYKINTAIIENNSLIEIICDLFIGNKYINNLILKDDEPLSYRICELLIKTNIENVNCYSIQPFMLDLLDKHKIVVESRNEILFLSNFMKINNLSSFSSIYYKITLQMDIPLNNQDEIDFESFCKINKYLKTINVNKSSLKDLEFITDTLINNNKRNIRIVIYDNITDENKIEYLRDFNKKKSKKRKIRFILKYSDKYIGENIVKQTNSKILSMCAFIIILIICVTFCYVFYNNYMANEKVNKIKDNINNVIEHTNTIDIIEDINKENIKNENEELQIINNDIAALLTINPETVGWLKVNNTNIDYPVVKGANNKYYLKHNFELKKDNGGWVFMDYRNSYKELDANTIIYAHNRYYNGVMFGTLQNTLKSSWYTNEENHILTFRTLYKNYKFKVFSVYKIRKTNDYISTDFVNDIVKLDFINMLKDRSIYDFNYSPKLNDKIITLSTCADKNNRIVLHAVLIK